MKILHTADLHLGSAIKSKLTPEKTEKRRREILDSFLKTVSYAHNGGVKLVIIAGDLFDCDRPYKKDKKFFFDAVRNNPDIDFLYLRGNHDTFGGEEESLPNLKTFTDFWTYYRYGNVVVAGVELNGGNARSVYSSLTLGKTDFNVVVMHGLAGDSYGKDKVNLVALKNKNIDYLALGHIHSHGGFVSLGDRGVWAYAGCPEGRGFDESGEKGFVVLETGEKAAYKFVPYAYREIKEFTVDVSGCADAYSAMRFVRNAVKTDGKNYVRVVLTGEAEFDVHDFAEDVKSALGNEYFAVSVKNCVKENIDVSEIEDEISLRGEFVRAAMSELPEGEERERILSLGLKAIAGRKEL